MTSPASAFDEIREISADKSFPTLDTEPNVPALAPEIVKRDAPTATYLGIRNNRVAARCSIWTEGTPSLNGQSLGVIGHYAATDARAGVSILQHAIARLADRGFEGTVGPMDGNTWHSYRLICERGDEPPFFLEPVTPDDWPSHWEQAGFSPLAHYMSGLNEDLSVTDPRVPEALERANAAGIKVRSIDVARFEEELSAVHELSLESFAHNFLYTPIAREQFLQMYLPLKQLVRPELVLLAESEARLEGFMFGVPNLAEAKTGGTIRTAIAKTLAVRPGRSGAGLGSVLMDLFQQGARKLGYSRVIHAFMHEQNRSLKITSRYGRVFRRYVLFARGVKP